jgi:EAL domain-containing protein (putative c-di-GMP-specific phosphodiesterase class I)
LAASFDSCPASFISCFAPLSWLGEDGCDSIQERAHTPELLLEALLRWNHPALGIRSPGEFISLAEETGMILPIGHWVLEQACAQIARWSKRGETASLAMAVNISARQFR